MKILFITRAFSADQGGMERLSFELITEVKKQPGISVRVLAHSGSRALVPLFILAAIPRILVAARTADVVHLGDPMLAFLGFLVKKINGKPVAMTVHGLDVLFTWPVYQFYLKLFARNFDLYLPISSYAAELLKTKVDALGKIAVINPGLRDINFEPNNSREELGRLLGRASAYKLLSSDCVLLTVGRLVRRKGHAWFIRQVLPNLHPSCVYVIAGDGPALPDIQCARQDSTCRDRILILGRVASSDRKVLLNTADAFIQPNITVPGDAEGFGLALLEAASCQRQIFVAHLEGMVDAIRDSVNGTLLPAGEPKSWIKVLNSFVQNPQPNLRARQYTLDNFNWPRQARLFISALKQLLPHN